MLNGVPGRWVYRRLRKKEKKWGILTAHEERRHEVDADERYAGVDGATERRDRGHGGGHVAHEPERRFAAHPVGHHARGHREDGHQDERGRKVRHDRPGVVLQLDVHGPGPEPGGGYVTEPARVLGFAHGVQERFFPHRTPAKSATRVNHNYHPTDIFTVLTGSRSTSFFFFFFHCNSKLAAKTGGGRRFPSSRVGFFRV